MLSLLKWFSGISLTAAFATVSVLSFSLGAGPATGHFLMRVWSRWCLALGGIRVEVVGLDRLGKDETYVVAANHQGQVDILILSALLPFRFLWVSKEELFRIPFLGWHMKRAGFISVDRSNRDKALASMAGAVERVRRGDSVVFFPEGTRSRDGTLGLFKKGAFHLAADSGVPILPVAIDGSFNVLPKGSLRIRPQKVRLSILTPIPVPPDGREDARIACREAISDALGGNCGRLPRAEA